MKIRFDPAIQETEAASAARVGLPGAARRVLAGRRRVLGDFHWQTFECEAVLAYTLVCQNNLDEAREIRDRLLPVATRVLGPDHRVTGILRRLEI